jgi:hypothetical protein
MLWKTLRIVFVCIAPSVAAQIVAAQPLSNFGVADSMARAIVSRALNQALPTGENQLIFAPDFSTPCEKALLVSVQKSLLEKGMQVFEGNAATDSVRIKPTLTLKLMLFVTYERTRGNVKRTVSLKPQLQLVSKTGEVLRVDNTLRTFSDVVPESVIAELESMAYPETQSTLAPTVWERIGVPAVTTAALGVVVYLFFSVRSQAGQ